MDDLERLRAMVDALEKSERPCVDWLLIYFHARRVVKGMAKAK